MSGAETKKNVLYCVPMQSDFLMKQCENHSHKWNNKFTLFL